MPTYTTFHRIFDKPLPENPTLVESLTSWNHNIKPLNDHPSVTEIFGELHFNELPSLSSSTSSSPFSFFEDLNPKTTSHGSGNIIINKSSSAFFSDVNPETTDQNSKRINNNQSSSVDSFSCSSNNTTNYMNSESLQLCTEGLGFESFDDIKSDIIQDEDKASIYKKSSKISYGEINRRSPKRSNGKGGFPPPISSCIGKTGKPWVIFEKHKQDGRFVLTQVIIPRQEMLYSCREDGRLKLHFIQPEDQLLEEDDEYEQDDENTNEYIG